MQDKELEHTPQEQGTKEDQEGNNREQNLMGNNSTSQVAKETQGQEAQEHKDINNQEEQGDVLGEPWEAHTVWTYIGHGEWVPPEDKNLTEAGQELNKEPEWIYKWWCTTDEDIRRHQEVISQGYPNRWGARRPVPTKWNIELLEEQLKEYEDNTVVEWMRYGWPTGRLPTMADPACTNSNHKGATEHPTALKKYISKEQEHQAVMGPFDRIPFQHKVGISPLSTRPKKDSEDCRITLDLSFPGGNSVNN